jgi:hypothetical protein
LTVLPDTDHDGLPDEWESSQGFSTTNATDAILDSDGDGATNAEEYRAGTDPHDPQDRLRLDLVRANDLSAWVIRFSAVSNRTYSLQTRAGLNPGDVWRPIADVIATPTNRMVEIIQPSSAAANQQIFQLMTPRSR